jgi:hypothetical protein
VEGYPVANDNSWRSLDLSRRGLLRGALMVAGGGAIIGTATTAAARAKMPQQTVHYQTTPRGAARCDGCAQWQPPAACKMVAGVIAPAGWCSIYAPRPKKT